MIVDSSLSKIKTKYSQPVYKETTETVEEKSVVNHMMCSGIKGRTI